MSKSIIRKITIFFGILSVIFTALPLLKASFWWIRIFDYPRVQIAAICFASIILSFLYLNYKSYKGAILILLLFLSLFYQLHFIHTYTPLHAVQSEKADEKNKNESFTILTANIKMKNEKVDMFLKLVEEIKPDILVVTEPNKWWASKLKHLKKQFPYFIETPLENTYGLILYSKFPLKGEEINYLVDDDVPSFFTRVALPDKQEFDLYTLHPKPPKPGTPSYERDTEILLVGNQIRKRNMPSIVVGDLNDVGWSYTSQLFQKYSELLDPRIGRGLYNTYNVNIPLFRYPLDHFFYSSHFGFIGLKRLNAIGSDHYPMVLEVALNKTEDDKNNLPKADQEDKKEVKEIIDKGK